MKRILITVGLAVAAVVTSCVFLPERFRVNAPIRHLLLGHTAGTPESEIVDARLRVPHGFEIAVYAEGIANPRMLRFTDRGDLLVSAPRAGEVRLLAADADGDGRSDGSRVLLSDLDRPHGLALRDGWLYVGETGAVGRIRFDAATGEVAGAVQRIVTGLPAGGQHWTRTLGFGPDDRLYVAVGSSCNVCVEESPRRAALLRYRPDGTGEEIYASGLRNTVGFDWHPETGALYATDNGRDLLGDDLPPCELNRIEQGGFYGWPFANGDRVPDPDLGTGREREIAASVPPAHPFRAHNAPLGIAFVRGDHRPPGFENAALVALHGSWNRTEKDGYKVVSLHWRPDGSIEERDFAVGFEQDGDVIGRPVDVAQGPDGAFYVSDDYAGVVWRVAAREEHRAGALLYERFECASCHESARATPGVVPVALHDLAGRYPGSALVAYLATPTPPMPAFTMTDPERAELARYLLGRFTSGGER